TKDVSTANTWYVWAKDAAGNTCTPATITSYSVSRSTSNCTLTTKYDTSTSSGGTSFTSTTVMLSGTPIYATSSANTGYNSVTLKHGSTNISNNTYNVGATEAISCSATANTYTVTLNKGTCATDGTTSVTSTYNSATINPSTITMAKTTYTISGFGLSSTRNSDGATVSSTSNITSTVTTDGYYTTNGGSTKVLTGTTAAWVASVSGYTDANKKWIKDGTATVYAKCGNHSAKTLPTITKSGYLCGWTTSSTGTTITYASGGNLTPTGNVTLYGVCIANKVTITVRKDGTAWSNSGMSISLSTSSSNDNEAFTGNVSGTNVSTWAPTNIVSGTTYYIWAGKNEGAKTTRAYSGVSFTAAANTTQTSAIDYYTVTINRNNNDYGTTSKSSFIVLKNQTMTASGSTLTLSGTSITASTTAATGYTTSFSKWTQDSTSGTQIGSTAVSITSAKTIYANFTRTINSYSLTVNPNGGTISGNTSSYSVSQNYNTKLAVPKPYRTGFTFSGWSKSGSGILTKYGVGLYNDDGFNNGKNSMGVYNNSNNGTVVHTKIATTSDNPMKDSSYVIQITTNGTASPGLGGFVQTTTSRDSAVFYHVIVAKIPVGYTIVNAQNATGNGRSIQWLTSQAGTGNYETYIYKHTCGSGGTFSTFGHVYLSGTAATSSNPVTWYVAYANMFDYTSNANANDGQVFTYGAGNTTITAQWTADPLTFNNQTLSSGTYGTAYTSGAFTGASNGTGNYTYTISSGAPSGATINSNNRTISFTNSTNVGTYNVVVHAKDNTSNAEADATMTITIGPKILTIPSSPNDFTYNGSSQNSGITCPTGSTASGTLSATDANTGTNQYYTRTCTLSSTTNYIWNDNTTTPKNITWKINPKEVPVTWGSTTAFTYNCNEQAPTASVNTGVTGETMTLDVSGGTNANTTSNPSYTSTASCKSVTGGRAKCANYTLTNTTKSFTIGKYTPTIALSDSGAQTVNCSLTNDNNFTATPTTLSCCSGTLTAASANTTKVVITSGASTTNAASGTAQTIKYKGICYTSPTNINVNYTPSDTNNCNSAVQKTYAVTVNKLSQTVALTAKTSIYTGSPISANTATASGGGTITYKYYTDSSCSTQTTTSNGATATGGAPANVGQYYVIATAAEVTCTSTKCTYSAASSGCTSHLINNASVTPNKGNCSSLSSSTVLYTRTGATSLYSGIRNSTAASLPTVTAPEGYTFVGWYTANGSGSKILNADGSFTGTAVSGYTSASAYAMTANKTFYAYCADTTPPVATVSGGTTLNQTSQPFTLSCTDDVGVTGYYWDQTEPNETGSNVTFTPVTSTKNWSGSGSANATGKWYLACKDAAGNVSTAATATADVVYYKVQNVLINVTGTSGTYTSTHYSTNGNASSSYYIKKGTTLTLSSIKPTVPTGASSSTYKGYTAAAPTTTAATMLSSNPTLNADTTYYFWYDRTEYTQTANISNSSHIDSITITNQRSSSNTSTSSADNKTVTLRYGEQLTASATPSIGYSFSAWKNGSTSTSNPLTITPNAAKTLSATATANTYTIAFASSANCPLDTTTYGNKTATYDADVSITNPTCTGYTFAGWTSSSSDGLGTHAKNGLSANPTTTWTGTATSKTHFMNLRDTSGTVTLRANWTAKTYIFTLDDNLFHAKARTQNGVTVTYDAANQYITLNGTTTSNSFALGNIYNYTPSAYTSYMILLTYVSGSFTTTAESNSFVLEFQKDGARYSGRTSGTHYKPVAIPSSGTSTGLITYTLSDTNGLEFWFLHTSGESTTFTNYKFRVSVTPVKTVTATYNSTMPSITVPTKYGFTFGGYYTGYNGTGTQYYTAAGASARSWDLTSVTTLYAKWTQNSTANPTCSAVTTSTLKSDNQTVTKAGSDNGGIMGYYWGTSEPTVNSTFTYVSPTTSYSGGTESISSAGTYYFGLEDIYGNVCSQTFTFYKYTVKNMFQNVTGSTYTTTDYTQASTYDYIAPSGTTIVPTTVYTIPSHSSSEHYQGISVGAPSTTAASVANENKTLSSNNTIYAIWFERNLIYFVFQLQPDENLTANTQSSGGTQYTWSTDSNNLIMISVNGATPYATFHNYRYGVTSIDLPNYNNSAYLNISKTGYATPSAGQYVCINGCTTSGSVYKHSAVNISNTDNELCNTTSSDCTITVKVNWTPKNYKLTGLSGNKMSGKSMVKAGRGETWSSPNLTTNTDYGGLYFPDVFDNGNKYLVTYKIQKTSGNLYNIGGHTSNATQKLFTIDGTAASSTYKFDTSNLTNITNDTNVHTIKFEFVAGSASPEIYIQPNRARTDTVTVKLTNIAIYQVLNEAGTVAYNKVYTASELPEVSNSLSLVNNMSGYVHLGWYKEPGLTTQISTGANFTTSTATFEDIGTANSYAHVYAKIVSESNAPTYCTLKATTSGVTWDKKKAASYQIDKSSATPSTYSNNTTVALSTGTFYGHTLASDGTTTQTCQLKLTSTTLTSYRCSTTSGITVAGYSGICTCSSSNVVAYSSPSACESSCQPGHCEGRYCIPYSTTVCGTHSNCSDACANYAAYPNAVSGTCTASSWNCPSNGSTSNGTICYIWRSVTSCNNNSCCPSGYSNAIPQYGCSSGTQVGSTSYCVQ
ncbi:MAG: InlB B-repeat-containing protein, partial [Bacilli bacterium]|nr:InlB B-repeat-containing protein [Bacilli bacterium]